MIKAISFDADDTLWDFEKVMRHALGCALTEFHRLSPAAADRLTIEKMVAIRQRVGEELRGKVVNLEEVRLAAFKETLRHVGAPDDGLAVHLNAIYLKHRYDDMKFFDDTLPTLNALQGRYVLGLLSNGNSYPERCGLGGMFQFVVFAQDYGIEKPDPRLFEIAVSQSGCGKDEFLHVGDSLQSDVVGARRAGVRSVWLNRERRQNDMGILPDFEIVTLTALADICERFE
ncbi:MAG: hypothetical protein A3F84_14600 [Candidatus Handelsmanbacteria bacterium RIFCSPLOWO2_12_FULL_64_10]|uniref:HAD family hydrolase n=1 Tax=Handelsmanbacteria sp. (strain RIFCSPLOWO2_12_FULL_64_10) TaxID=1817868 RepID=A0A1F6CA35_HANXR|nr:MAG: hypothetical protein A3F84_14600 [Candidatus Handelsmanbacteria bacterium RIFCSPLOWO2_12_FULL_64_10]